MSSRDNILNNVRKHLFEAVERPSLQEDWIEYPDPIEQFTAVLEGVGGQVIHVPNIAAISNELDGLPPCANAKHVVSSWSEVYEGNVDLNAIEDPHDIENVDFAILPAEFGVAENAAVWVTDKSVKHRAIWFLCQHLAFVMPRSAMVHNMHQAYDRISFDGNGFGVFISGPSKTADIEQSLVIGAHGARSLTIFFTDE